MGAPVAETLGRLFAKRTPRPTDARRVLPGALFVLLVVGVYADPLFFRRNFGGRDLLGYSLPIEFAIHDAYSRGRLPVWNSEISGGRPLAANPNSAALYPLQPLLALFPFPLAVRIFPVFHWALSGLGMIFLLRTMGVSAGGAWLGAVTYVFSGVGVSEVFYIVHHPGVTLLPWIVWALARRTASRPGRALMLSFLFGLDFLAGDVFTIGVSLVACALWIWLEVETPQRSRLAVDLVVSLALAALLALPQILATLLWIPETNRGVLGMRLRFVFLYSVSPFRLLEFVIPFPFGATWALESDSVWGFSVFHGRPVGFFQSLYAGAFPVVALVAMRRERPVGAHFARVLFLAGLVVCVPGSLLPLRWGNAVSPLPLRYPEKFAVSLVFALAILAGLAFDSFRRGRWRIRWSLVVGALLALGAIGVVLFPEPLGWVAVSVVGTDDQYTQMAVRLLPVALAEGGLLWMATVIALELLRQQSRIRLAAAVALLTLVPIAADRKIARSFREDHVLGPTPFARFLQRADPHGVFRTMEAAAYQPASRLELAQSGADLARLGVSRERWEQFTQILWRRGTVFNLDYDSGDLSRLESLRQISFLAATYRDSQAFFGALALRWAIRFRDQEPLAGYHRVGGNALLAWDEQSHAHPDIRLLERWHEEASAVSALNALPLLREGEIVIESGTRGAGRARPGRLRVIEKTPERLLVEAVAPDPTWLFVLRGYWNHRTVLVDGSPAEDQPAQLAFSAVRIPAGRHRIEWKERLPGSSISRFGPLLYALVAAALLLSERRGSGRA